MEAILLIEMLCLVVAVGVPVLAALRRAETARGAREPALALHRAQLRELDRDRDAGLVDTGEHAAAVLEVQRRLLRAADTAEPGNVPPRRRPLLVAAVTSGLLLVLAGLYLWNGHPDLGPAPAALRAANPDAERDAAMVQALHNSLVGLDPASPQAGQGWRLLGQVEAARGDWKQAASAWQQALRSGFDPAVAVEAAEATVRATGTVDDQTAALFRRALAAAPADAPWRQLAEDRLAQHSHAEQQPR